MNKERKIGTSEWEWKNGIWRTTHAGEHRKAIKPTSGSSIICPFSLRKGACDVLASSGTCFCTRLTECNSNVQLVRNSICRVIWCRRYRVIRGVIREVM